MGCAPAIAGVVDDVVATIDGGPGMVSGRGWIITQMGRPCAETAGENNATVGRQETVLTGAPSLAQPSHLWVRRLGTS